MSVGSSCSALPTPWLQRLRTIIHPAPFARSIHSKSTVEFRIVAENTVVVERNATARREIALDARTTEHVVVKRPQSGTFSQRFAAGCGERIAQAGSHLRHRQVCIGDPRAYHPGVPPPVVLHHALEIAKKFGHAALPKFCRAALRLPPLLLVVK